MPLYMPLQDVTKFLPSPSPSDLTSTSATSSAERSKPGYLYCQGLYARYTNDVSGAILYFNKVCIDISVYIDLCRYMYGV